MLINKLVCDKCGTVNDTDAKFCKCCGVSGEDGTVKRKFFDDEVSKRAKESFEEYVWGVRGKCKVCGGVLLGTYCGKCDIKVFLNDVFKN